MTSTTPDGALPTFTPYTPRPRDLPTPVPLDEDADLRVLDDAKVLAAPDDPAAWPRWRAQLERWRREATARLDHDGARYGSTPTDVFVVSMAWLWDELLYDHAAGRFTVDAYVNAAADDFGGVDGVVLWHAYPNQGIDDRDQFAYYRGVPELPEVVDALHRRGVRAYLVHYPWEESDPDQLADLVRWTGADGVFVDSMRHGSTQVRAALDRVDVALAMEAESTLPLAHVHDHTMSWAQWFADSRVPGVLRTKWFERRHVLHHTRRWHRSHLDELHSAWLNGVGMLVWECVFGVWVGWNARDRSMLRTLRRVFHAHRDWIQGEDWTPLADHPGGAVPVHASRWGHDGRMLWTVVNRGGDHEGPVLHTDVSDTWTFRELTDGRELEVVALPGGRTSVATTMEAGGIAAILATPTPASDEDATMAGAPTDRDATFPIRVAERRPAPRSRATRLPVDGVVVPAGRHELVVHHRVRETGLYGAAPYVDEWKPLPPRLHQPGTALRSVEIGAVAVAATEVTNREFAAFLDATGYRPARPERFLAHWDGAAPRPDDADRPVTHLTVDDARACAAWMGARLPTEDEWQLAAGLAGFQRGRPEVWNLTESEHADGRTRFLVLKGGSAYQRDGSPWYFDGGVRDPAFSATYLRMGAGLDRSPNVGFRCAVDLEG